MIEKTQKNQKIPLKISISSRPCTYEVHRGTDQRNRGSWNQKSQSNNGRSSGKENIRCMENSWVRKTCRRHKKILCFAFVAYVSFKIW